MTEPDYGRDLAGFEDIDAYAREVTGPRLVAERLARRFITARGTLIGAPADGMDLRLELNDSLDSVRGIAKLKQDIQAEALKDECVDFIVVKCVYTSATRELAISMQGDGAAGPFALTLNVSAVTVELLAET